MTFMATAEAISYAGARPVFVDIDPNTYARLDPNRIEAAITPQNQGDHPCPPFRPVRGHGSDP